MFVNINTKQMIPKLFFRLVRFQKENDTPALSFSTNSENPLVQSSVALSVDKQIFPGAVKGNHALPWSHISGHLQ